MEESTSASALGPQRLPLTCEQVLCWNTHRFHPGYYGENLAIELELEGPLDRDALRWALDELIRRHPALRTTFSAEGGERVQLVHDVAQAPPVPLELVACAGTPAERAAAVERARVDGLVTLFDYAAGPLLRAQLFELAPEHHVLLVMLTHAISDATGAELLVRDLAAHYEAFCAGDRTQLPDLGPQYARTMALQWTALDEPQRRRVADFWRRHLDGMSRYVEIPPQAVEGGGQHYATGIPLALPVDLDAFAQAHGATPFVVVTAALRLLMQRYVGTRDFGISLSTANRGKADAHDLIAALNQFVVLRAAVAEGATFAELLQGERAALLAAMMHQTISFPDLLRAGGFEEVDDWESDITAFSYRLTQMSTWYRDLRGDGDAPPQRLAARTRVSGVASDAFLALLAGRYEDGLRVTFGHNEAFFTPAAIERLAREYERLLGAVLLAPGAPVDTLGLPGEDGPPWRDPASS